ncbi:MAG: DNA topoisomerase VI subunit B [Candidatus Eisenbacteria bacterium]|nr:DNA topoisomerase VI subunit B [Candidatus Eisenbacteria bacterium]
MRKRKEERLNGQLEVPFMASATVADAPAAAPEQKRDPRLGESLRVTARAERHDVDLFPKAAVLTPTEEKEGRQPRPGSDQAEAQACPAVQTRKGAKVTEVSKGKRRSIQDNEETEMIGEREEMAKAPKTRKTRKTGKQEKAEREEKAAGLDQAAKAAPPRRPVGGDIAQTMASKQRDISIAEFFAKNRHLLGFDNPAKALLTTVKEAVDNALDACDEAGILPEILVSLEQLEEERFCVTVEDNGPGIVRAQIPKIFGKLLYGSKFHALKQSRGQQGIGISAAGMYGLLTTGKPVVITSRAGSDRPAHHFEIVINTEKNTPDTLVDTTVEWDRPHGTRVAITLQGLYKKGRHSIDGYLLQVAVANPHATIRYQFPGEDGQPAEIVYARATEEAPRQPKAIKPHPHGVELGIFLKMMQNRSARTLRSFLKEEFSRVGEKVITDLMKETTAAGLKITPETPPRRISVRECEAIHTALGRVKIMAPPTDCLSPIGENLLLAALRQRVPEAHFYTSVTRPPAVYRGNPFQIEVALAYGGDLPEDGLADVYRYANRVPLQYQRSACAMTKAVVDLPWRNYKISQSRGALPTGPLVLVIHIASVWVPFTSESKEAVAHYPEILHEIRLALQECGRRLGGHIGRSRRVADEEKKRSYIQKYIPHIGIALQEILNLSDKEREKTVAVLTETLERSRRM